jgi:16S rRNA C967 or C1407 C5-methylase (RsmB/RsmF family)
VTSPPAPAPTPTTGWADRCLVDPPCSGLGNRPRFIQGKSLHSVQEVLPHQRKLIAAAIRVLKPDGGVLVYSTCTVNMDENEGQTRWILDTYPQLKLVPQTPCLHGQSSSPGLRNNGLSEGERMLVQRFDPAIGPGDTVGFYCAKFVSRAASF